MALSPVYGDACSVRRIAGALARNTVTRLTVGDTALHALDLRTAQQLEPHFRDCHSLLRLTLHLRHLSLNALRVLLAAAATCHSLTNLTIVAGTLSITESKVLASGVAALTLHTRPATAPHTPQPSRPTATARQRAWSAVVRADNASASPPTGAGLVLTLSLHTLTSATAAMLLDGLRRSERVVRCELRVEYCADDEARALLRQCNARLRALTQRNRERIICAGLHCRVGADEVHDVTPRRRIVAPRGRPVCPHTPVLSVRRNAVEARASYAARFLQTHAAAPPPSPRRERNATPGGRVAPNTPRENDGGELRSATDHFRHYPRRPSPTSSPVALRVSPHCEADRRSCISSPWAQRAFTPYSPAKFASPTRPRRRRSSSSSTTSISARASAACPGRQPHVRRDEHPAAAAGQTWQCRGRAHNGASSSASRSPSPRPPPARWCGALVPPPPHPTVPCTPQQNARGQVEAHQMRPVTPVTHRAHTPTHPPRAPMRRVVPQLEKAQQQEEEEVVVREMKEHVAAMFAPTRQKGPHANVADVQGGGAMKTMQSETAATTHSAPSATVSVMHEELTPERVSGRTQGPSSPQQQQPSSRRWHSSPRVHIAMGETKTPSASRQVTPHTVDDSSGNSPASSTETDEEGTELQAVAYIRRCVRDINTALVRHQVKTSNVTQRLVREVEAWNADLSYRVTVQLSDIVMVLTDIERATTSSPLE